MQIGGTLISGLVRLLVVVGILAAISFFILKPILSTTENSIKSVQHSIGKTTRQVDRALEDANISARKQSRISGKIKSIPSGKLPHLNNCITRNPANIAHIERCVRRLTK